MVQGVGLEPTTISSLLTLLFAQPGEGKLRIFYTGALPSELSLHSVMAFRSCGVEPQANVFQTFINKIAVCVRHQLHIYAATGRSFGPSDRNRTDISRSFWKCAPTTRSTLGCLPVFPGCQRSFPPSEREKREGDKRLAAIAAWRRGWDSNPYTLTGYWCLSRTLPYQLGLPLQITYSLRILNNPQILWKHIYFSMYSDRAYSDF